MWNSTHTHINIYIYLPGHTPCSIQPSASIFSSYCCYLLPPAPPTLPTALHPRQLWLRLSLPAALLGRYFCLLAYVLFLSARRSGRRRRISIVVVVVVRRHLVPVYESSLLAFVGIILDARPRQCADVDVTAGCRCCRRRRRLDWCCCWRCWCCCQVRVQQQLLVLADHLPYAFVWLFEEATNQHPRTTPTPLVQLSPKPKTCSSMHYFCNCSVRRSLTPSSRALTTHSLTHSLTCSLTHSLAVCCQNTLVLRHEIKEEKNIVNECYES